LRRLLDQRRRALIVPGTSASSSGIEQHVVDQGARQVEALLRERALAFRFLLLQEGGVQAAASVSNTAAAAARPSQCRRRKREAR
jgi:hypothetical protein